MKEFARFTEHIYAVQRETQIWRRDRRENNNYIELAHKGHNELLYTHYTTT